MRAETILPRPPEGMTATQAARRRRVLHAVIELVREKSVDDVSMKDVADRSGVALGTIYRYFSSKDHVLAVAMSEWVAGLDRPSQRQLPDGTPEERLVVVLRRALRAYEREPAFARLLIHVLASDDEYASREVRAMGTTVFGALDRAGGDGIHPEDRDEVMAVIGAVWFQSLSEWVRGRRTIADVRASLESAVRLLMHAPVPTGD